MNDITLVMLCAGNSSRFGLAPKKQWLRTGHTPIWQFATEKLASYYNFEKVIVVTSKEEIAYMQNFNNGFTYIAGGNSRQESMKNALEHITSEYVMFSDVARSCVPQNVINSLIEKIDEADCIVPFLHINDTVVYETQTIKREDVKLIQTPQLSKTEILKKALKTDIEYTDDSSAIKAIGGTVCYILGDVASKKLTFEEDLKEFSCLESPSNQHFVGIGFDVHPFVDDKQMVLGGVKIDTPYGFKAHSDGDVLIHSLIDALLGACGAGDIGEFFPDTDEKYKNVDSRLLLQSIVKFITQVGYEIINIDLTIIAEQPKINPYKLTIKEELSALLGIKQQFINVKATTSEKLGFIGRCEGIAVQSIATLNYYNWRNL